MAEREKEDRHDLAKRRIMLVLQRQIVANARTLEQKIADAGPSHMRIDPHVLIPARNELVEEGLVQKTETAGNTWFHLANTPPEVVTERLEELANLFRAFTANNLPARYGQTLEIATYRALCAVQDLDFFGHFPDLHTHDDSKIYSKTEPPNHIGIRVLPGQKLLDFMVLHPDAGFLGLECKNVREWMYPNRSEIRDLLLKCTVLNCLPVFIARRIPFVTFKLLNTAGALVHQTYNQLMPETAADIVSRVRHKDMLGYHDIRMGNHPDARLLKFITTDMMNVAVAARDKFDLYKDLLAAYGSGEIPYHVFAAKIRRRSQGTKEDDDWPEGDEERAGNE
ncbi:hypothetical protein [Nitratireductor sp. GCM10026969]|uniref:hypothetical protein n=1 Tax=Nitratireductor sp. GCM10026969 TaxID=3252645 RepID=UPI003608059C